MHKQNSKKKRLTFYKWFGDNWMYSEINHDTFLSSTWQYVSTNSGFHIGDAGAGMT